METFTAICENVWIIMIFVAFFVCLAKGWLKKGFYLTSDQAPQEEEKKKHK